MRDGRTRAPDCASAAAWLAAALARVGSCSFPAFLRSRAPAEDRTALVFQDRRTSYRDLFAAIDRAASTLLASGLAPGERVMIKLDNSDLYVVAYLAVLRAGLVAVPVNPKLTPREIAQLASDCGPALFVSEDGEAPAGEDGSDVARIRPTDLAGTAPAVRLPEVDGGAAAAIYYTSGTTGRSKGVVHTHAGLVANALQSARAWGYNRDGLTTLALTPLFHIAAHAWFLPVLAHGGTLVIDGFRTERAFELIERHAVASLGAVPSMLLMMTGHEARHRFDLGSVRNLRFGASPMPPDRLRDVQALFPNAGLYHGMGQTESGGTISVLPPELAFSKAGGTGFPLPGCEVRIVDEAGRDVAGGAVGEVLARGPQVMREYLGRPDDTEAALSGGWLHTGDLGYVDPDGCIFLVDRKKDMIIRGGENIYSVEVETALLEHDAVAAAAVVALPDPLLGERVCAVVVARREPGEALAAELKARCREVLAAFKVPDAVVFVDDLPRTATGKIQKAPLRRLVAERSGGIALPPTANLPARGPPGPGIAGGQAQGTTMNRRTGGYR